MNSDGVNNCCWCKTFYKSINFCRRRIANSNPVPPEFTFNAFPACPDTEFNPVPPLAIGKVPDVIELVGIEAKENVPKETTFKISLTLAPEFKTMLVPLVAVQSHLKHHFKTNSI